MSEGPARLFYLGEKEMKLCNKCNTVKDNSEFRKRTKKNGHEYINSHCWECEKKYSRDYGNKYKEKRISNLVKWREKNKEWINKYSKNYAKTDKAKNASLKYYYNHKEQQKIRHSEYCKNRKINDIEFKIVCLLRSRLCEILENESLKPGKMKELIGCSLSELKHHLEKQFQPGMTWKNHGLYGWHIDHKIPCDSFDMTNIEHQKQCFNYKNLQPLWATENLKKGVRI